MGNLVLAKPQLITTAQKALVTGRNYIVKQSPIILAGAAIAGVCTTGYLAAKGGIRANALIEQAEYEKKGADGEGASLTIVEKIQIGWKPMAPAIISGGLTIAAIIGSATIFKKRQAAIAGLYALSESALKEYQDKIEEKYGSKEAQATKDSINSDHVTKAGLPPWDDSTLPAGDVLCFDKISGRYFISSVQKLKAAQNDLNSAILRGDMCASINELYSLIDNPNLCEIGFGEEVGWNIDNLCKLYFTSALTSDMRPCLVMDFECGHEPNYKYRDI